MQDVAVVEVVEVMHQAPPHVLCRCIHLGQIVNGATLSLTFARWCSDLSRASKHGPFDKLQALLACGLSSSVFPLVDGIFAAWKVLVTAAAFYRPRRRSQALLAYALWLSAPLVA